MRKRISVFVTAIMVMTAISAPAAFAGDPSPGNSGHEGGGQFTAKFVPAATPGNSD